MDTHAVPGMIVDARGQLALAILSNDAVGVTVTRFSQMLTAAEFVPLLHSETWITVYRDEGEALFLVGPDLPNEDVGEVELKTPQENEAAQMAVELAVLVWPEWCPGCRKKYKPETGMFIPFLAPDSVPTA